MSWDHVCRCRTDRSDRYDRKAGIVSCDIAYWLRHTIFVCGNLSSFLTYIIINWFTIYLLIKIDKDPFVREIVLRSGWGLHAHSNNVVAMCHWMRSWSIVKRSGHIKCNFRDFQIPSMRFIWFIVVAAHYGITLDRHFSHNIGTLPSKKTKARLYAHTYMTTWCLFVDMIIAFESKYRQKKIPSYEAAHTNVDRPIWLRAFLRFVALCNFSSLI